MNVVMVVVMMTKKQCSQTGQRRRLLYGLDLDILIEVILLILLYRFTYNIAKILWLCSSFGADMQYH